MMKPRVTAAAWNSSDLDKLEKVVAFFGKKGILVCPNFSKMPAGGYEFSFYRVEYRKIEKILTSMYGPPVVDKGRVPVFYKQPRTARSLEIWLSDLKGAESNSPINMMYIFPRGSGL